MNITILRKLGGNSVQSLSGGVVSSIGVGSSLKLGKQKGGLLWRARVSLVFLCILSCLMSLFSPLLVALFSFVYGMC